MTFAEFILRRSMERGHADHGWLKSFHTFSFASYFHPRHQAFGPLRVINEDRVKPTEGFGKHPHSEFEIFSYVVSGELSHTDSMGHSETLKRGDIQMTSAGTGIAHAEYNKSPSKQVHFLQIWALPYESRLKPTYYTRHFTDEEKLNNLLNVVSPVKSGAPGLVETKEGSGPVPIHSNLTMYASILEPKKTVDLVLNPATTKAYAHLIMTSGYATNPPLEGGLRISASDGNETNLESQGDGVYINLKKAPGDRTLTFENTSDTKKAEFIFFELVD